MAVACSALGPLPRNAATDSWQSHRSKTFTRDGSRRSAAMTKSRQPGACLACSTTSEQPSR
jgi:hypothetical protein